MALVPAYNRDNINVGLAAMYVQPYSLTVPAALPDDTAALGAAWPDPWTSLGASDSGLEFAFSRKTNDIMIEEQAVPVDTRTDTLTFQMNVTLAEDTLATMKLAYGGGVITDTPAGTGTPGVRTLVIADEMDNLAFGFEVENELGFPRRILVPKAKSVADIKTSYVRAKDKRMYQVSLQSLVAAADVIIREITAAAL